MPEKNWSQIIAEIRGLRNRIVSMEDYPDADFIDIVDCLECAADGLELRYQCSGD